MWCWEVGHFVCLETGRELGGELLENKRRSGSSATVIQGMVFRETSQKSEFTMSDTHFVTIKQVSDDTDPFAHPSQCLYQASTSSTKPNSPRAQVIDLVDSRSSLSRSTPLVQGLCRNPAGWNKC